MSRDEMQLAPLFMINCTSLQKIKYFLKENVHICLNQPHAWGAVSNIKMNITLWPELN